MRGSLYYFYFDMNEIRLTDSYTLDIVKTFECGQCFRWNADPDGVYHGTAGNTPAEVFEKDGSVFVRSDVPEEFWNHYFDLDSDYSSADALFTTIPWLDECTEYGRGIRILRQDPWEALCSFIISQCNNIARIKGIVERLCLMFGTPVEFGGTVHYGFPAAERLSCVSEEELAPLRSGYRAPYIISAARMTASGELDLEKLKAADCETARKRLKELNGIGDKVANCVVLFGLHHMEAFPIDVWIRRALSEHFPKNFNPESLGPMAGLAQQYMFYYERERAGNE